MSLFPDSPADAEGSPRRGTHQPGDRLDSLAAWVNEIDARLRVAETATGDEKTAKELRKAVEAAAKHDPKLGERLGDRIDVLADRVATLATTVSTTAAALARKDGEIVALQREIAAGKARLDEAARVASAASAASAAVGASGARSSPELEELRKAVSKVAEQKLPKNVEGKIDDLKASVSVLTQRLETLSSTVSTTASGLAGREGEVAAVRRSVDEVRAAFGTEVAKLRALVDPEPVAELQAAVKTLSDGARSLGRDGQRRHDAVQSTLEAIAQRVEALGASLSTVTRDVATGGSELTTLRAAFDEESTRVDALLVKLHQATGELSARMAEAGGFASGAVVESLGVQLSALAGQVDILGTTVEQTAAGYAAREHEIAALGRHFEEITAQVDAGVRELRDAVARVAEDRRDPELEQRVADLATQLESVSGELHSEQAESAQATQALAALQQRLDTLARQLDQEHEAGEASAALAARTAESWARDRSSIVTLTDGLESRIAEVRARLDEVEASAGTEAVAAELRETTRALDDRLRSVAATVEAHRADADAGSASLERRLAEAVSAAHGSDERMVALERALSDATEASSLREAEVRELSDTFQTATARVDALVDDLQGALRKMPTPVSAATVERGLGELAERLDRLEQGKASAALEIARASAAWAEERASLEADLEAIAQASRLSAEERATAEQRLEELAANVDALAALGGSGDAALEMRARLERIEQERASLAGEIAGATSFWAAGLAALETKLEEVAAGHDDPARKMDDEVVRALFDLARRLDVVEQGHAADEAEIARATESWAAEREFLAAGLDELSRRLDAHDRGDAGGLGGPTPSLAHASAVAGEPADGRFRLELRALELRMEHSEVAARENREAVLVQLERLASRVEWRLQRLETGSTDDPLPSPDEGPLAKVVQIHGGDA